MNDYYLLIGLNRKEVKITNINQKDNGIVEVSIESKKKKVIITEPLPPVKEKKVENKVKKNKAINWIVDHK